MPCQQVDYFNQIGLDVMEFNMPVRQHHPHLQSLAVLTQAQTLLGCRQLIGCNRRSPGSETSHQWFEQYEKAGVHTIKYFIEPVVLAINYAQTLG